MVYAGIIALIFIGELFIKNHVEKNRKDGEEKEILPVSYTHLMGKYSHGVNFSGSGRYI